MTGFINTLMDLSLKGSVIIALIIIVRFFLKKAPKVFSYWLWAIAFVGLVFPFSIKSPLSFKNFLPERDMKRETQIEAPVENIERPEIRPAFRVEDPENMDLTPRENFLALEDGPRTVDKGQVFFYIWICGFSILMALSLESTLRLKKRLRGAQNLDGNTYKKEGLPTAFVFGLVRPKIYLPASLNPEEEKYIRKHEEVHIERLDHVWKFLAFIITSIHFFNPLVWLAYYLMGLDMELSCDERVIRDLGHDIKKNYSRSLLSFSTGRKILTASPLAFGENNTKTRIKNILSYKKPKKYVLVLCLILVATLAVGCLTDKNEDKPSSEAPISQEEITDEKEAFDPNAVYESPEEFLEDQIQRKIDSSFVALGTKIDDYRIEDLKKVSKDLDLDGRIIEVYKYSYSIKSPQAQDLAKSLNGKVEEDSWVSDFERTPFMIFEKVQGGYRHLGYMGEDLYFEDRDPYDQGLMVKVALVNQDEKATVEDFAENHMVGEILFLNSQNGKVRDYKIDKLEKINEFKNIYGKNYEVYLLNYSLKIENPKAYDQFTGFIGRGEKDGWISDVNGDNYMIFQKRSNGNIYLGSMNEGEFDLRQGQEGMEQTLREFLEKNNIIPRETYPSDHYIATYRDYLGRAKKLLLSQPVDQGDGGIFLVERWIDENGNVYYEDLPSPDDLEALQEKVNNGEETWRRDPEEVAKAYIEKAEVVKISDYDLDLEKLEDLGDFYTTPVSKYLGYIEEIKLNQKDLGDLFHVTLAEWLTLEDKDRLEVLKIDPNTDLPGGFIIYKTQVLETFFLSENTKYYCLDPKDLGGPKKELSRDDFIAYAKENPSSLFEFRRTGGNTLEIAEVYIP